LDYRQRIKKTKAIFKIEVDLEKFTTTYESKSETQNESFGLCSRRCRGGGALVHKC